MSDQISLEYDWNDENSVGPHATAKGTSNNLCTLIATTRGKLFRSLVKKDEHYCGMGEMLADCFCFEGNQGMQFDIDYHRTDLRILDFIRSAVEEKLNNDQFMDKFVKENY